MTITTTNKDVFSEVLRGDLVIVNSAKKKKKKVLTVFHKQEGVLSFNSLKL